MSIEERYDVYDKNGRKVGEIERKTNYGLDGGCIVALVLILILAAVIGIWFFSLRAAINGDLMMRLTTGLSIVSAIFAGERIKGKEKFDTFWKKYVMTALCSGGVAGIIMMIIVLIEEGITVGGAFALILGMIVYALLPSLIVTVLENPDLKKK